MCGETVGRQQTPALAGQRRCRAQHPGDAIRGAKTSDRFGSGRTQAACGGHRQATGGATQIRHPVRYAWRCCGSTSISRALISASRSSRARAPAASASAERRRHLVRPCRALDHLAPPLQSDQRQRRLAHRLARARQLVVEGVERQQRGPPSGGANSAVRNRSGSCRRTKAKQVRSVTVLIRAPPARVIRRSPGGGAERAGVQA